MTDHRIGADKVTGKTPLESKTKKEIIKIMKQHFPDLVAISIQTRGFGDSGHTDIAMAVPVKVLPEMVGETIAVYMGVEVKRDFSKNLTPLQEERIERLRKAGASAGVVKGPYWPKKRLAPPEPIESVATQLGKILNQIKGSNK